MSVDISSMRKSRVKYPPKESQEFLSMEEYLTIAKKVIGYYCKRDRSLVKELISSEDAISFVAESLMMGDWRYKPVYKKKTIGPNGPIIEEINVTRRGYRNKCAIWAIKKYINKGKKASLNALSLDFVIENSSGDTCKLQDLIEDKRAVVIDEKDDVNKNKIKYLLNNSLLTDNQKQSVTLYFLGGLTLEEVGVKLGMTKQGVQQNLQAALDSMRLNAGVKGVE